MTIPVSKQTFVDLLNVELRNQPGYHAGLPDFHLTELELGYGWPRDPAHDEIYISASQEAHTKAWVG